MTATEMLVAEELLKANPDSLPLVQQWIMEKKQSLPLSVLQGESGELWEWWKVRDLTDVEELVQTTLLALIAQAKAEE